MADEQELARVEALCQQLYEGADAAERVQAESQLSEFCCGTSPDCLQRCRLLLDRSQSSYAQLLAATTLGKLVSKSPGSLSLQQRLEMRNYILSYLWQRPKGASYVTQALVQLFARLTKLGWFDSDKEDFVFRNVIRQVQSFLQGSVEYCMIGVQLLSQLTCEMNHVTEAEANRSLTKQRKIASSFRDSQLYDIFQLACDLLRRALESWKAQMTFSDDTQQQLMSHLLRLAHHCLSFDFIGTSPDESSDDLCTVQIPTGWRPAFLDYNTLQLFFDLFHSLPVSLSPMVLTCLVQIASVRRSLFNNAERAKFLSQLVTGVKHILENPQSLSDPNSYHEFCRLLARLKSNYQLGELVKVETYPETIALIAKFTVTSLQMWQFAPNSVHYLLSLWQRMVASVPYVKASEPHLLDAYTPEVTRAYITSRLDSVSQVLREGLEDPLDDMGMVQQQLDQLSTIGRCEYEKTCALLVQLLDQSAQAYREAGTQGAAALDLAILEGQLSWLVYIIGAAIGGRASFSTADDHDAMDGELVCRSLFTILQLMQLRDSRLPLGVCSGEKLELALLSFFEQFRKIYVGDQVPKTSKRVFVVYRRLSEVLGLSDDSMVLSVFVRKIITNLKYWSYSDTIVSKTLQLLSDLSVGYSSVRKLVKLEEVQFMLSNHTSEHFPFLGHNNGSRSPCPATSSSTGPVGQEPCWLWSVQGVQYIVWPWQHDARCGTLFTCTPSSPLCWQGGGGRERGMDMRCRSTFYTSLGRLLMVELGEDEERFVQFMRPLTAAFETIGATLANADSPLFNADEAKKMLIGLARDLRGLVFAFNTKTSYMMLFEWIYPAYFPILHRALELWYHDPSVSTPVLKLVAELVQNRSQRLHFDVSSPNGILLFRETSRTMVLYGTCILTLGQIPKDQVYKLKLKGIAICFSMLKSALCGGYVNLGVFSLYGDSALDDALGIFVKLLLSIPQSDLLDYPKLSQAYYVLLECLAQDHMHFLSNLEPPVFLYILSSVSEGLTALALYLRGAPERLLPRTATSNAKMTTASPEVTLYTMVCTGCCATLDHIVSFLFRRLSKGNSKGPPEPCLRVLELHPEILQQMLSTILNIIMFEDCRNQWSMSRPLLGLILLNEEYFGQLRQSLVSSQPVDKQATMSQWFDSLMDGIERNLLTKNRDRFTQNLSVFRRDINDSLKGPTSLEMMT